jgi:hypothetical protein
MCPPSACADPFRAACGRLLVSARARNRSAHAEGGRAPSERLQGGAAPPEAAPPRRLPRPRGTRYCAALGCGRGIPSGSFLCREHFLAMTWHDLVTCALERRDLERNHTTVEHTVWGHFGDVARESFGTRHVLGKSQRCSEHSGFWIFLFSHFFLCGSDLSPHSDSPRNNCGNQVLILILFPRTAISRAPADARF